MEKRKIALIFSTCPRVSQLLFVCKIIKQSLILPEPDKYLHILSWAHHEWNTEGTPGQLTLDSCKITNPCFEEDTDGPASKKELVNLMKNPDEISSRYVTGD